MGAMRALSWPKIGWVPATRRVDPAQMASPVDIRESALIDAWGSVHSIYEIQAPTTDVFSAAQLNDLQDWIVALVSRMPESITETCFFWTANGDYTPMVAGHLAMPASNRLLGELRHLRSERLRDDVNAGRLVRCSTHLSVGSGSLVAGRRKFLRQPVASEAEFRMLQKNLDLADGFLADECRRLGIRLRRLAGPEMADYFYRVACPRHAIDLAVPCRFDPEATPWLDAWLLEEIDTAPDLACTQQRSHGVIQWGDSFHTMVTLSGKPLQSQPRCVEAATAKLPFRQVRYHLRIHRLDQSLEKDALAKKRMKADQMMNMPLNFLDRAANPYAKDRESGRQNVEAREQIEEANALIADIRAGRETLLAAEACWHLWHRDPAELLRRRDILVSRLADMGSARGYIERHGALISLLSSMPAAGGPMVEPMKYRSRMVADLVPLNRGFETSDRPVAIFHNATGGLVPLDLFDTSAATAPMTFVSGKSGAGKSVAVNHLIVSHALRGTRLMIVDFGGSYDALAGLLGVPVFRLDAAEPKCLNVFQLFGEPGPEGYDPRQRNSVATCIEALCTDPADGEALLPAEQRELLDMAVEQVMTAAGPRARAVGTLSDVAARLRAFPDAKPLLARMRPFLRGENWGQWFDGPMEWSPGSQAFVLDFAGVRQFRDLSRGLVPLAVSLIYDQCSRDPGTPKVLCFEELWEHVANPRVMDMIIAAFKTFRKQGAAVLGVSQSLADLDENARAARAVLQNAQTYFLFEQGDQASRATCASLLALNDGEAEILRTLGRHAGLDDAGRPVLYRECLMVRGAGDARQSGRVRVQLMPEEYWIYTSDPAERSLRERAIDAAGGDVWLAIRTLARQFPLGAPREPSA